ncbi:hypothetical protein H5410_006191 [Solanum commersonii]|uniref:Uncharacterized protein n=1 Tax=Solanum commersonii TaxID=4109 RepID=A0A9J6A8N7_SOLCO|nr:hypothetical protein H5410_006191 [Solanum commersonii]
MQLFGPYYFIFSGPNSISINSIHIHTSHITTIHQQPNSTIDPFQNKKQNNNQQCTTVPTKPHPLFFPIPTCQNTQQLGGKPATRDPASHGRPLHDFFFSTDLGNSTYGLEIRKAECVLKTGKRKVVGAEDTC